MITYVNDASLSKYSKLFEDATADLKKANIVSDDFTRIESLSEYFQYIKDLALLNPIYTRLPLDEEVFEIDANTRTITVPKSFQNNGISVQGDVMSEILYFKINRFYDDTDLAQDDMKIYIQWQNAEGKMGATAEWTRDVESEPGFIIFGWPITSEITKTPGTVKFAVRFYKLADDKKTITYSLSTLNASVSIKTSLNFNVNEIIADDMTQALLDRLVNSPLEGIELDPPVFTKNLESVANLDLTSGEVDLMVQAYAPKAAGVITYTAYKNGIEIAESPVGLTYVETADIERAANKIYYTEESAGVYKQYTGTLPQDKTDENRLMVYECYYVIKADSVGEYYVRATNTSTKNDRAYKNTDSARCVIPTPKSLEVAISKNTALVGDQLSVTATSEDNAEYVQFSYKWKNANGEVGGATKADFTPAAEGIYKAEVTNTLNKEKLVKETPTCRVTYAAKPPVLTCMVNGAEKTSGLPGNMIGVKVEFQDASRIDALDSVAYQWYTRDVSEDEDISAFAAGTYVINDKVDKPIAGAVGKDYTTKKTENDIFFCMVTNTYNGTTAQASSDLFYIVG